MAQIEIKNLTFKYAMAQAPCLENLTLQIEQGDFVVLCGKSGCGKTTLLRCLKTVLRPAGEMTGEILYLGKPVDTFDERMQAEQIGFVLQNPEQQIVTDKVWHELAFGLENLGISKEKMRARVGEIAEYFGITKWYEMPVNQLSGGQKQILNLAAVMVMRPRILILDEPTAQLDPIAAERFIQTLKKINDEIGTTILLSEHRLDQVLPIADKVVVMEEGKIIAEGKSKEVAMKIAEEEAFAFMPVPVQVYHKLCKQNENLQRKEVPLTIGEGRKWLQSCLQKQTEGEREKTDGKVVTQKMPIAIQGKNLWFRYERESLDIIKGANLTIRKGEIYCILGGNGAGKTTLLSIIAGMRKPYRGKVKRDGKIAFLSQNVQTMFLHDSVGEEIEQNQRALQKFGLEKYREVHPYDLSGGEQQKLALAKILLSNPEIILLDEPTKAIDNLYKKELGKILEELCKQGTTIVMVSHDMEFCAEYGKRCALFFDGKILSENETKQFFAGNHFYTTSSHKMADDLCESVVTKEDLLCFMTADSIME